MHGSRVWSLIEADIGQPAGNAPDPGEQAGRHQLPTPGGLIRQQLAPLIAGHIWWELDFDAGEELHAAPHPLSRCASGMNLIHAWSYAPVRCWWTQ